jgi:hypothetical protein
MKVRVLTYDLPELDADFYSGIRTALILLEQTSVESTVIDRAICILLEGLLHHCQDEASGFRFEVPIIERIITALLNHYCELAKQGGNSEIKTSAIFAKFVDWYYDLWTITSYAIDCEVMKLVGLCLTYLATRSDRIRISEEFWFWPHVLKEKFLI